MNPLFHLKLFRFFPVASQTSLGDTEWRYKQQLLYILEAFC